MSVSWSTIAGMRDNRLFLRIPPEHEAIALTEEGKLGGVQLRVTMERVEENEESVDLATRIEEARAQGIREGLQRAADHLRHLRHFGTGNFDRDLERADSIERLIPMVKNGGSQ